MTIDIDTTRVKFACPDCGLPGTQPQWMVAHSGAPYCDHAGRLGIGMEGLLDRWTRMVPFAEIYERRADVIAEVVAKLREAGPSGGWPIIRNGSPADFVEREFGGAS